jgi:hypothetical protein
VSERPSVAIQPGSVEVAAEGLTMIRLKAFLIILAPLAAVLAAFVVESSRRSPLLIGVAATIALGLSAAISAASMWARLSPRLLIRPDGVEVRVGSALSHVWLWSQIPPPDAGGFPRALGLYELGFKPGPYFTDEVWLTRGQLRALVRYAGRPSWNLPGTILRALYET